MRRWVNIVGTKSVKNSPEQKPQGAKSGTQSDDKQQDSTEKDVVVLLSGVNAFGDRIYNYLKVQEDRFEDFMQAVSEKRKFGIRDFGEVLAAGKGVPDPELQAEMEEQYQMVKLTKKS